jgi:hypothetical protein
MTISSSAATVKRDLSGKAYSGRESKRRKEERKGEKFKV